MPAEDAWGEDIDYESHVHGKTILMPPIPRKCLQTRTREMRWTE